MSVRFILGRAGTGKTHHCVSAAVEELSHTSDQRLIFLAPEQATFQIEQAVARAIPVHGFWRLEVLSFSRLTQRALAEFPGAAVISDATRRMALRLVVQSCAAGLGCFGRAVETPGFLGSLERFLRRCQQECVSADQLRQAASSLVDPSAAARLQALAACLAAYQAWLGPDRIDPGQQQDQTARLVDRLEWLRGARLWVDGFAGFTGQEIVTLTALCRAANRAEITLLLDGSIVGRPDPLSLFGRTERTHARLQAALRDSGQMLEPPLILEVPRRFLRGSSLARLEAGLAAGLLETAVPQPAEGHAVAPNVRVLALPTVRDEIREAAAWIRRTISERRGAVRFRDFALIARDLEPIAAQVREIFREHELPFFLDQRRSLRSHGLGRYLAALTETIELDAPAPAMGRLLRSGLLPLSRDACERLENRLLELDVSGLRRWEAGLGLAGELAVEAARLAALLSAPLAQVRDGRPRSARAWAVAFGEWLDALQLRLGLEGWIASATANANREAAEVHRLAWEVLQDALAGLVALDDDRPVAWSDFRAALESAFDDATVGLTPPTLDQVLISSIDRSRHPDIQHAWIIGFNEGVFPKPPTDEPLLGLDTQRALAAGGLEAFAPVRDDLFGERLLAYIACTRPLKSLTISYHTREFDGAESQPSVLLADVRRALPELEIDRRDGSHCATLVELVRRTAGSEGDRQFAVDRTEQLVLAAAVADAQLGPQVARLRRGRGFTNQCAPLGAALRDPAWPSEVAWRGTPSDLETYLQCPFKYFIEKRLRLKTIRGPMPAPMRIGIELHHGLAEIVRKAIDSKRSVRDIKLAEWQDWIDAAAKGRAVDECNDQEKFEQARVAELLKDVMLAHVGRWARGALEPVAVERFFGVDDRRGNYGIPAWPPLTFDQPQGKRVEIEGYIDRIDIAKDNQPPVLVIYDYKSSLKRSLRNAAFTLGDVLQLFTYLLSARARLEMQEAGGALLLAPLYPTISGDGEDHDEDAGNDSAPQECTDARLLEFRPRGLISSAAARAFDLNLESKAASAVVAIKRNQDGSFHAKCDVCDAQMLTSREKQARATIDYAVRGLMAGEIGVLPLLEGRTLPCKECDCVRICRFERAAEDMRIAENVLPQIGGATPSSAAAGGPA